MSNKLNTLIALCALLIAGLACGGTKGDKPATADAAAPDNGPAIVITAEKLISDFKDNEVAAGGKYDGKKLEVTGTVSNISDTMGNITVSLKGKEMELVTVMCSFKEAKDVVSLKKGQKATLVGTGDGMTGGLYVGLKDCKIK